MADNFHFDLTGVALQTCMDIAFGKSHTAVAYEVQPPYKADPEKPWEKSHGLRMVFFWHESALKDSGRPQDEHNIQMLPGPMKAEAAAAFVKSWLETADYGNQPDHDGDNAKGWRVYNDSWNKIERSGSYSFVAIEPVWLMYGK